MNWDTFYKYLPWGIAGLALYFWWKERQKRSPQINMQRNPYQYTYNPQMHQEPQPQGKPQTIPPESYVDEQPSTQMPEDSDLMEYEVSPERNVHRGHEIDPVKMEQVKQRLRERGLSEAQVEETAFFEYQFYNGE